jgi:hypothetical protein
VAGAPVVPASLAGGPPLVTVREGVTAAQVALPGWRGL